MRHDEEVKCIVSTSKVRLDHLVDKFLNENPQYKIADAPYFKKIGRTMETWHQQLVLCE